MGAIQSSVNQMISAIGSGIHALQTKENASKTKANEAKKNMEARKDILKTQAKTVKESKDIYFGNQLIAKAGTPEYKKLMEKGEFTDGK